MIDAYAVDCLHAAVSDAAAAELSFTHGVAGTWMEDVRRAAGVSGPQITH